MPSVLFAADVVCSMVAGPVADGGVLVGGGRIIAVGLRVDLEGRADRVLRLSGVLLPGLVVGVGEVELADAVVAPDVEGWGEEAWGRSARRGVQLLLRAGVTCAGDVVGRGPGVPALARAGVLGDSYVVVPAGGDVEVVLSGVASALDLPSAPRRLGLAPAVDVDDERLRLVAALASARAVPLLADVRGSGAGALARLEACGALGPRSRVLLDRADPGAAALLSRRGATAVLTGRRGQGTRSRWLLRRAGSRIRWRRRGPCSRTTLSGRCGG